MYTLGYGSAFPYQKATLSGGFPKQQCQNNHFQGSVYYLSERLIGSPGHADMPCYILAYTFSHILHVCMYVYMRMSTISASPYQFSLVVSLLEQQYQNRCFQGSILSSVKAYKLSSAHSHALLHPCLSLTTL